MITLEFLRQFKVGPFTIFDTVTAYLGVLILSPVLSWLMSKMHIRISVTSWLWFTLPLSVIFHIVFSQPTPLIRLLANPRQLQFYIVIFILVAMIYMGSRNISRINN